MTDKELYELMLNDDRLDQLKVAEHELSIELAKPIADQDYARIDELIRVIEHLNGEEENNEQIAQQGLEKLHHTISKQKRSRIRRIWATAVSTCAVLLLGSNIWSYSAYGINAFSAVYQILNGGILIDFSQSDSHAVESEANFSADMCSICSQNEVDALIPSYIPYGFEPAQGYGSVQSLDDFKQIYFYFTKSKEKLNLVITEFRNESASSVFGFPTDSFNVTQETINGHPVYILKEEKQYSAGFMIGKTHYLLAADGLDFDECYHVLISMIK